MAAGERIACQIPADCAGMRLDQALAALLPAYSRSRLQQWLKAGQLRVDGRVCRPRDPVAGGETVSGEPVLEPVSYTHLRAHETVLDLVCRLLLEKKQARCPPGR
ncbi:MAG TPA: hypothetical protein DIC59_07375, partial [Candidatus Competibacteraceae bacterium]|nr:hypothetical protein [Candidatus Competibacteraceae bacterium]